MSNINLQQYQIITTEGDTIQLEYDYEADMLEIFFAKGRANKTIELADPIIIRFDRQTRQPLSLSILTFSKVIQQTEFGPTTFPLHGLNNLHPELKEIVSQMIQTPPVSHFLKVVAYAPHPQQPFIPLSYMNHTYAPLSIVSAI
jgi:hypothetical protein